MLRIGFDASPLMCPVSGVEWHTYHLFRSLLALKQPDVQFVGYVQEKQIPTDDYSTWTQSGKLQWANADHWGRWKTITNSELDLFHGTNFKMPLQGKSGGIVTIHDLWLDRFPQYSKKLFGQMPSYFRTRKTARKARCVIAVSQFTANDICELYGLTEKQVVVIPNGVSQEFFVEENKAVLWHTLKKYSLPSRQFILFVGGANPRKNHRLLLNALARCPYILKNYCLVVVGQVQDRSENIMTNAKTLGIENRVVCMGKVSVTQLRYLYNLADLFVLPSIYEGFGMPVLEAMACGVPSIVSTAGALPEVAGNAALMIDPYSVDGLAFAIQNILEDSDLRTTLENKGIVRAKRFSWVNSAKQTMSVYCSICT